MEERIKHIAKSNIIQRFEHLIIKQLVLYKLNQLNKSAIRVLEIYTIYVNKTTNLRHI